MKLEQEETPDTISAALMEFAGLPSFRPSAPDDPRRKVMGSWIQRLRGDQIRVEEQTVRIESLTAWSDKWWKALAKLDRFNALFLYSCRKFEADYGVKIAG